MSSPKLLPPASPQGESQLLSASAGGSPRSASESDQGSFQITASALGIRVCEILYEPFKSSISFSPPVLLYTSPTGFQRQTVWGFIFLMQDLQARKPDVGLRLFTPWGEPLQL